MTKRDPEFELKFRSVFFPYAKKRIEDVKSINGRLVYYTSAATAYKILDKEEVWLRNVRLMNDYSEVSHGRNCLTKTWNEPDVQAKMVPLFKQIGTGIESRIQKGINSRFTERAHETFILCISEHGSVLKDSNGQAVVDEDQYGRLSMWRAYGGDTNVAFVFKSKPFFNDNEAFDAFTSPVLYADQPKFKKEFIRLLDNLEVNIEWLKEMGGDFFVENMEAVLFASMLSTKHPAFAEEREWRIIYSPTFDRSPYITEVVEVIGGIPQLIQKLPLKDIPDKGLIGISISDILDKIIIGPTPEPIPIATALYSMMSKMGVPEAQNRIKVSRVPLRK